MLFNESLIFGLFKTQINTRFLLWNIYPIILCNTIGIKFGYECCLGQILHVWYGQAISCTRRSRVQEWRLSVSRVQDLAERARVTKLDFFSNSYSIFKRCENGIHFLKPPWNFAFFNSPMSTVKCQPVRTTRTRRIHAATTDGIRMMPNHVKWRDGHP